jgi:hypothetical protein
MDQLLMKTVSVYLVTINVPIVTELLITVLSVPTEDFSKETVVAQMDTMIMVITHNVNYVWISVSPVQMPLVVTFVNLGELNNHQSVHVQMDNMNAMVTNVVTVLQIV